MIVIICIIGLLVCGGLVAYLYNVNNNLPQITSLADYDPPVVSSIYSRDGQLLLEAGEEKRLLASFMEIPQRVVNCFLAAEDDSFYEHGGIDYMGIARSMVKNILAGRVVQGGSTITQQVAKTFFTTGERTFTRKIKDMLLAKKIEDNFTKPEILFLYLNQMYFGGGYHGVKMAAKGYFNKELEEVTIAEGALLAGLLARPHGYSPYVGPEYAKARQRYVLKRLYKTGKITELEYEEALEEELKIYPRKDSLRGAGHFVDWVKKQIFEKMSEQDFLTGGYEVVTSLDWKVQKAAEKSVIKGLKGVDKRQGYKGPIGYLKTADEISNFFMNQRFKKLKEQEDYQILNTDGVMISQLKDQSLQEEELQYYSYLELGETVKAVVVEIDEKNLLITAKISDNITISIDREGYQWARPRKIFHKPLKRLEITKPSQIVKKGDIILVEISQDLSKGDLIHFKGILDQEPEVEGAFLAMESETGEVLAMVGGKNYKKSQYNRAIQSKRQPGSVFKSFYYAAALEKGYTPATILMDTPYALTGASEDSSWKPQNYDKRYLGPVTFRRALEKSRNIPSIKVAQDVGVGGMQRFLGRLGISLPLPRDLSFALGAFEIKLYDLVKGYSIFAAGGKKVKPRSILFMRSLSEDKEKQLNKESTEEFLFDDAYISLEVDSDILVGDFEFFDISTSPETSVAQYYRKKLSVNQVYDERLAYLMNNILRGVIQSGTGRRARKVSPYIAGKTGTTNDYVDAWFVGYNRKITAGVWVGFDTNRTLGYGEGGGVAALPIWANFMSSVIDKKTEKNFKIPTGIINVNINKETGELASLDDLHYFTEAFVQGTEPSMEEDTALFEDGLSSEGSSADDDFFLNQ